jgi:hypothetical protein
MMKAKFGEGSPATPRALALADALRDIGFPVQFLRYELMSGDKVFLAVGAKP